MPKLSPKHIFITGVTIILLLFVLLLLVQPAGSGVVVVGPLPWTSPLGQLCYTISQPFLLWLSLGTFAISISVSLVWTLVSAEIPVAVLSLVLCLLIIAGLAVAINLLTTSGFV
jgi:hypothetical protein